MKLRSCSPRILQVGQSALQERANPKQLSGLTRASPSNLIRATNPAPQSEAGRSGNTPQHTSRDLTGCGSDCESGPDCQWDVPSVGIASLLFGRRLLCYCAGESACCGIRCHLSVIFSQPAFV